MIRSLVAIRRPSCGRATSRLLDQVLAKSGVAGVFFTPKGADHRADGRFVPIPLTAGSLDDAVSKAALCEHGLGIALWGDKFAVRTRREHADEVRKIVSPDAPYVEVPSISDDESLYVLKNVPGQPSRDQLTQALVCQGRQATGHVIVVGCCQGSSQVPAHWGQWFARGH